MRVSTLRRTLADSSPVSCILSMLASSIYSAADVGSLSCVYALDLSDFDQKRFIDHNYTQRMHALLDGLRAATDDKAAAEVDTLSRAVNALLASLQILEGYTVIPDGCLADTTFSLTASFHDCKSAIKRLARKLETPVVFLEGLTREFEEEHEATLARLLPTLRLARDTGKVP